MLKRSLGLYPTPLVECIAIFNQLVFQFGKCGSFEGMQSRRISLEYPRGGQFADGLRPGRPVKGVWHDQLANSSLPSCIYAGIVLLEEKLVFNSLKDWKDMWVKDFNHIRLAFK